jgi:hypothetical protein
MRLVLAFLIALCSTAAFAGDFTAPGSAAQRGVLHLNELVVKDWIISQGDDSQIRADGGITFDDDEEAEIFWDDGDNELNFIADTSDGIFVFRAVGTTPSQANVELAADNSRAKIVLTNAADNEVELRNDNGDGNLLLHTGSYPFVVDDGNDVGQFKVGSAAGLTGGVIIGDGDQYPGIGNLVLSLGGGVGAVRWQENDLNGQNYFQLVGPAALAGDVTCTIDASGLIPTSCIQSIDSAAITNSTIVEADLNAIDVPNDEECLTYEAGDFEWQACGSQTPWTSDIDAGGFDLAFDDNTGIYDDDGDQLLIFQDNGGTDVNWLEIQNAASGANPSFIAAGSDGNIGFNFYAKGNAGYSLTVPRFMMDLGAGGGANLVVRNSSDTSFGPGIAVYHDTVSPAAGDTTFFFTGQGEDSAGNAGDVAGFDIKWIDPTATLEDGEFIIKAIVAGTHDARLKVSDGVIIGTGTTYPGAGNLAFGSGGVINWDASDVLITHSANDLAFTGVTGDYSFDDTVGVTGSVTASVNVTATAGDVTSGDDVIPGDDVELGGTAGMGINWSSIMNLSLQGTDLVSFQGGSFGVHQATATIASGSHGWSRQYLVVDTEAAAASDDNDTVPAPPLGGVPYWLQAANDARTVNITTAGNWVNAYGGNCVLDDDEDIATAIYNSTLAKWVMTGCYNGKNPGPESFTVAASDETTPITATAGKIKWRVPYAFTLASVKCSLSTAQNTTGAGTIFTVDINEGDADLDGGNPVSILSTKLTIDDDETTSATATTAAVISDTALAADAEMSIDVDAIGASADAAGLKCTLIGRQS